jgi:hypothetical protein
VEWVDTLQQCERAWIHFNSGCLIAGWMNQYQHHVIEYLIEEIRSGEQMGQTNTIERRST